MKYRKKPLEIEALQFQKNSESKEQLSEFLAGVEHAFTDYDNKLLLRTPEGIMEGYTGDWVIKGIAGEFYICQKDIFAQTYEPVSAD